MPFGFGHYVLGKGRFKEIVRVIRKWFMTFAREPSSVEAAKPESNEETGY